jgi:F-type H+-transporting ATPase subunit delta
MDGVTSFAKALFQIASLRGEAEDVETQLQKCTKVFEQKETLNLFLHPRIPTERKEEVFEEVTKGLSSTTKEFLLHLLKRKRLALLPAILEKYRKLVDKAIGRVRVRVVVAHPLPSQLKRELERVLAKKLDAKILLQESVDASLIGGIVTQWEDKVIDGSIKGRVERMKEALCS